MTEDTPSSVSTHCLACKGIGEVHSYAGDCVKVCPACRGQHKAHTYKEGCKKHGEQKPKAEPQPDKPSPEASSSSASGKRPAGEGEQEERPVTRMRTVRFEVGDPDSSVKAPDKDT